MRRRTFPAATLVPLPSASCFASTSFGLESTLIYSGGHP